MHLLETFSNMGFFDFHHWAYLIIFFASLAEALPIIGLFIPGMFVVIAGGVMVKLGGLHMGNVIVAATLGAIASDFIGYFLGKRYGMTILERYGKYFFFHKRHFEVTQRLIQNHAGKALIVGRFNSITRCFGPFIAGTMDIGLVRFVLFNVVGGTLWATTFVLLGYAFSQSYEAVAHVIGRYVTLGILAGVGIILLYRFIEAREHIFAKFHLYTLTLNVVVAFLFAHLVEGVIGIEHLTPLDARIHALIPSLFGAPQHAVMFFFTAIANSVTLTLFTIILSVWFLRQKKWDALILLNASIIGGGMLVVMIKELVGRLRPTGALIEVSGYSFPSGHATMAIIVALTCIYLGKDRFQNIPTRRVFEICVLSFAFLVGCSRIYLNVHWTTDVLAGFALGTWWFTTTLLVVTFVREELLRRSRTCRVSDPSHL
ncbi:MAG: bifunctional DedA family/phosphatase PAP2 family protein [Candidatus Pacebacteria bacterium]|nr:bifunctional DedA family/phosphatase PAP2 family protein [Candidatus Paceibacterota bacterium]